MGSHKHNSQQRNRVGSGSEQRSDDGRKKFTFGSSRQEQGKKSRESNSNSDSVGNKASFTPQQRKVIIEHLLITKSTAPQKNYSHVPCKFFRQGSCQAGDSCPFSHSLDVNTADQRPCEYFKRGNCKFGSKCANAHILPDGVRINPPRQYKSRHPTPYETSGSFSTATPHAIVENCIYEEDEEFTNHSAENVLQSDGEDECEEFYIPTDFAADLLTPEELRRRNSRSSSSSFKKPDFTHSHSVSSSSSSFGSEHLFGSNTGYHQRTYSNASLSSSISSTTTSPLMQQQLSYLQPAQSLPLAQNYSYSNSNKNDSVIFTPKTQQSTKVNYSPWSPIFDETTATRGFISSLGNDLSRLRIDEESTEVFSPTQNLANFDHSQNYRQDTQFFFDDIPVTYNQM